MFKKQKDKQKDKGEGKKEEQQEIPPGLLARSASCEKNRPDEKGCYGFKGGVLAFVDWDGELYVTPGTRLKVELLEDAGLDHRWPKIKVPYSDGAVKSKRWLRKNLPPQEIKRSVEENLMPRVEAKVWVAVKKVNREGLSPVDSDFIKSRCARAEGKYYNHIGLIASYRGMLSFTDWEADTYLTPYSEEKRRMLEMSGYVYAGSMINVPYGMDNPENREWLAKNIPYEEWEQAAREVEEERNRKAMEEAKSRIEKLGLKELPGELLEASAACEEKHPQYIGMSGGHNGILSFTDPEGVTYVTPALADKVELLKSLGYQFMGAAIKVPYSLRTQDDIDWLSANIDEKYWAAAREANLEEKEKLEKEKAETIKRKMELQDLPEEFLKRSIKTEQKQLNFIGQYYVRNDILGFIDTSGIVYITPVLKSKVEILKQAKYKHALRGFPLPYSNGTQEDLEYIRQSLSQGELDLTQQEIDASEEETREKYKKKILDRLELKELPAELMERSAKTEVEDMEMIGRYQSRGGVTCFIRKDGCYYVTPTVHWKEKALRDAGYQPPEKLIRVPYGSESEEDRLWLEENLPSGELEKSRQEIEEQESRDEERKLKKIQEELGIGDKVPKELAEHSAKTEGVNMEQIGCYLVQDDFLGFVGPDGSVWITPNSPKKTEMLKEAKYQYADRKINLPHTTALEDDLVWRRDNLPEGEEERTRREVSEIEQKEEDKKAKEITAQREIKELPEGFLDRFVQAQTVKVELIGRYLERFDMIYLIAPDRYLYISPSTPNKLKTIKDAGYLSPAKIDHLLYCSGDESAMQWIMENLPAGEMERCQQEQEDIEKTKSDRKIAENMEKFSLEPIPDSLLERSADSGHRDPENIGRIGIFRGVLAFVQPDERTFVTWYTEEKQEKLEDCGYQLEGYMPIKVPYAMAEKSQRQWLLEYLPEPDGEEKISMEENAG